MYIRKIKNYRHIFVRSFFWFFGIVSFVAIFFLVSSVFRWMFSTDIQTSFQNNSGHLASFSGDALSWNVNDSLQVSGFLFSHTNKWNTVYFLQTQQNIRYILTSTISGFFSPYVWQFVVLSGTIKLFYDAFPYVFADVINFSPSPDNSFVSDISGLDTLLSLYAISSFLSPIRPIPPDSTSFRIYDWYTMYVPQKMYYEIFSIEETLGQSSVICDTVVHLVSRSKKSEIAKDIHYIKNHPVVKVYVCKKTEDSVALSEKIGTMQSILVDDKDMYFYVDVVHSDWFQFATQITVR